jgi:putative ABC transport system permease protein
MNDFSLALRFARRELRGGLHGFRIFLACLALGVAAIAAVGSVRSSIQDGLIREGATILGGDAEIQFTYRYADPDERAWIEAQAISVSEMIDFRSMIVVDRDDDTERALTQVYAADTAYPLKGAVQLDPPIPLDVALAGTETHPGLVTERLLADRLGIIAGDTLRLGDQAFVLMAILDKYPDSAGAGFSLGPRSIVLASDLADSGLLAEGTLFDTKYRLSLAPDTDLDALETSFETAFTDSGARWRDARNGAPQAARFVDRIGSFLILVGLSGLAVGGVGVSAAIRCYLSRKTSVIATLKTLGASRRVVFLTYVLQIGALTILGLAIGLLLGAITPLIAAPFIRASLPLPLTITVNARPLIEAALYGLLTAAIFTLWPLARAADIRAATLFRDAFAGGSGLPRWPYLITVLILVGLLIFSAALFSGTLWLTLWTSGGIIGALLLLTLAALGIRRLARSLARFAKGRPALRLALSAIGNPREDTLSVVLSLGLGLSVLAAVGQIDGNLRNSISQDLPEVAPSYFFVDIQPDQIDGFRERLTTDPEVSRIDSAPILRGVITMINDRPANETAGQHWVLRGDRGVTYSALPDTRTTITDGEWWPENHDGPNLISFAAQEAAEMNLTLGDTLTVNILGRDITGTIANFREVDFSTAGIGFVLSFNPAALRGAPHTYLSTVYAEQSAEAAILRDLTSAYPNITAIRVKDAIDRIAGVLGNLATATSYGAIATLLTGFLVLIGAAAAGQPARTYEAAILKTLGASRRRILTSFALRAALLGAAAGGVALFAGILGGWAVATFIMEDDYQVFWGSALWIITGGIIATLLASLLFSLRALASSPAQVLRNKE